MSNEFTAIEEATSKATTVTGLVDRLITFRKVTIFLCVFFICIFSYIYYQGYKKETINYLSNFYLTIPLIGGVFGLYQLFKVLGRPIWKTYRLSVSLFCCGLILWAIGCGIYMFYNLFIDKDVSHLLPVEVIYITCFLLWTAGIIYLYECARKNVINDANSTITILIPLWGGIATVIYFLQAGLSTQEGNPTANIIKGDLIQFILSIIFPIIDLYNLGLLITLLPSVGNEKIHIKGTPLYLIVIGYFFLCLASTSFTICGLFPDGSPYEYHNGSFTDVMFTIAFTFLNFGIFYIIQKEKQLHEDAYQHTQPSK